MKSRGVPVFAVLFVVFASALARADEAAVIDRWYAALLAADRGALSDLLADDARIRLADIEVEQDKREFLASMDEWQGAVAGATIRHRIEQSENGLTSVIVCYDFPANDLLTRETFALAGDHITASSQASVADSCDGY